MLSSHEQAFVGRDERRSAPLKTPAWEASAGTAGRIVVLLILTLFFFTSSLRRRRSDILNALMALNGTMYSSV